MRTIRLLIDWPVNGLWMKGWIVEKETRTAALLVKGGFAEYVRPGTSPPPSQIEWANAIHSAQNN